MQVRPHREAASARRWVEVSPDMEIVDPGAAPSLEMHRPVQACVPPVVLILDPCRIGIPDHHDGQQIRAADEVGSEVELRRQTGVLAHADERAVTPHDHNALGTAEVHDHITVAPGTRHRETSCGAGRSDSPAAYRGPRCRATASRCSCSEADPRCLDGPAARHIDRAPALIRGRRVHPSSGCGRRRLDQAESPGAVERPTPGRANTVSRRIDIGMASTAARGKAVDLGQFGLQHVRDVDHAAIMAQPRPDRPVLGFGWHSTQRWSPSAPPTT